MTTYYVQLETALGGPPRTSGLASAIGPQDGSGAGARLWGAELCHSWILGHGACSRSREA